MTLLVLAAEVLPQDITGWVVGFVLSSIAGVLAFLLRNALGKVETGIEGLGVRLDALKDTIAIGDGDRRVLEARVNALEREMLELRREVREASEGVVR